MKNEVSDEVERIGLNVVAAELKTTVLALNEKLNDPKNFKLSDLAILQNKFGFTDKMIRSLIDH